MADDGAVDPQLHTPGAPDGDPAPMAGIDSPPARSVPGPEVPWTGRLLAVATPSYRWLTQPRVRLSLTGGILLLIGGLLMTNSVWTLPVVIVGALMVIVAWIGHRLDGRLAIEWGDGGTELIFRATIKPAQPALDVPALPPATTAARGAVPMARTAPASMSAPEHLEHPEHLEIIEGDAHTVEIDVGELKALIAAVEAATPAGAPDASAADGIRIHRSVVEPR